MGGAACILRCPRWRRGGFPPADALFAACRAGLPAFLCVGGSSLPSRLYWREIRQPRGIETEIDARILACADGPRRGRTATGRSIPYRWGRLVGRNVLQSVPQRYTRCRMGRTDQCRIGRSAFPWRRTEFARRIPRELRPTARGPLRPPSEIARRVGTSGRARGNAAGASVAPMVAPRGTPRAAVRLRLGASREARSPPNAPR